MKATRAVVRAILAALLAASGTLHLAAPEVFFAQVPDFLPFTLAIVYVSGVVELLLAIALLIPRFQRHAAIATAAFFVAIFPGNIWQAAAQVDAFGLTTDVARIVRLAFQPVLIVAALFGGNVPLRLPTRRNRPA